MRKFVIAAAVALGLAATPQIAKAAGGVDVPSQSWAFEGVFGTIDIPAAQRGLQVYKEVCASCHGLSLMAYRNLAQIGFSEEEIKALAADYTVMDGPNDDGEMFERAAIPSDRFVSPYANEQEARAINNGAYPVDLSLIIKARADGANYLYALLTGYREEAPEGVDLMPGMYYNEYYGGNQIAMPQPLYDDFVEYSDGTQATVSQMAKDVTYFLKFAAEPSHDERKQMGIKVIIFLLVFTGLAYASMKKIWADVKK
ncbi:MAG: cytochrome c1 [Alphaproteobacteria bacterium]|nr:cytochrome c1 [Alphaproteobacteria bacterium]